MVRGGMGWKGEELEGKGRNEMVRGEIEWLGEEWDGKGRDK